MLFGYAGESDASKTVALYQKGCDLGGQYACANLAFAVSQGMGTGKQDIAKGLEIAQHACDNNNDYGCYVLAETYMLSEAPDFTKVVDAYQKSCDLGNEVACSSLGEMYLDGYSIPKEQDKGATLLDKACNQNYGYGCFMLGNYHYPAFAKDENYNGSVIKADLETSIKYFEKGCKVQDQASCDMLRTSKKAKK